MKTEEDQVLTLESSGDAGNGDGGVDVKKDRRREAEMRLDKGLWLEV